MPLIDRGFCHRMANGIATLAGFTGDSANTFYIYKGTMSNNLFDWQPSDSSTDLLASFTTFDFDITTFDPFNRVIVNPLPVSTTTTAVGTGTATWFAWHSTNITYPDMYIFGDVSISTQSGSPPASGALWLDDINIVAGNTVRIENFGIAFNPV